MKKLFVILLLLYPSILSAAEEKNVYKKVFAYRRNDLNPGSTAERHGQTFMWTRPVYRNQSAQNSLWHSLIIQKPCGLQGALQVLSIFQQTLTSDKVGRYFLLNENNDVIIKGDDFSPDSRDVRAEWLGLPDDFAGIMSVSPWQRQFAAWIEYNQDIKRCIPCDFFDEVWVAIAMPIQYIENNIRLSQKTTTTAQLSGPVTNIVEAFNRQTMDYGKIRGKKSKSGVAELMFKLGVNFPMCEGYEATVYSLFVVPTHGSQSPEFLFDPFIGNNGHWGFGTGMMLQLPLNKNTCDYIFSFFFNIQNIFFLRKNEHRTLGLKNTEWGQYLLVNTLDGDINVPASNFLTRKVRAEPFNAVDLSGGLRWSSDCFEAEFGFNLWARADGQLKLREKFKPTFGIAGDGTTIIVDGVEVGATASKSTINFQAENDMENGNPAFVPIQLADIDFAKGISRAALSYRGHIAFGRKISGCHMDAFIGGGGYIQASNRNTSLKAWGVWAKFGVSA